MPRAEGTIDDALVVRPKAAIVRRDARARRGAAIASAAAFALSGIAFGLRSGMWLFGAGVFGGGAIALAYVTLYFHNVCVFVRGNQFGMTTRFGRTLSWDRSKLARVVLKRVKYGAGSGQPEMYFLDGEGNSLMVVSGSGWDPDELAILWRRLDIIPDGSFADVTTLAGLSRTVPVAWWRKNLNLLAVLATLVFIFGVSAVLVALGVHVRR